MQTENAFFYTYTHSEPAAFHTTFFIKKCNTSLILVDLHEFLHPVRVEAFGKTADYYIFPP